MVFPSLSHFHASVFVHICVIQRNKLMYRPIPVTGTGLARGEKMKEKDYCNFFYPVEKSVVNVKNIFLILFFELN